MSKSTVNKCILKRYATELQERKLKFEGRVFRISNLSEVAGDVCKVVGLLFSSCFGVEDGLQWRESWRA